MRWVREVLNLSGAEAARLMGVHVTTLHKIEQGERAASVFNVIDFSIKFHISTDFLLRGQLHGRTDEELALELVARHPEIVLARDRDAGPGIPGRNTGGSKYRPPRTPRTHSGGA
jgi:transcriptional regulator with XRE-family HTH domain